MNKDNQRTENALVVFIPLNVYTFLGVVTK